MMRCRPQRTVARQALAPKISSDCSRATAFSRCPHTLGRTLGKQPIHLLLPAVTSKAQSRWARQLLYAYSSCFPPWL